MRRLSVLPCPEAWQRMRAEGDGRFCERCRLRVTEVAGLDRDGLEQMLEAAVSHRVCARFELDRGRPKLAAGLAAGLVVVALSGCATPVAGSESLADPTAEPLLLEAVPDPDAEQILMGVVVEQSTLDTSSPSSSYSSRLVEYD
ncbi:MAG TPA: hypothetical protein VK034_05315 [Enhygromyxa sp.]|nr:hypothetical protein [Enhygromyxa sp.]